MVWNTSGLSGRNQGYTDPRRDGHYKPRKGGPLVLPSFYTDESGIETLSGSGYVEAIQTPEPVAVRRHKKSVANSDDRLRMDGTRHSHGVYQCTSRVKPTEAGNRFS